MNELISFVIPVYKVEKFLHRCIDSVLRQSYSNLEIIVVDDGSPDTCGAICDQYALLDKRVHVIHQENGGLSDARNTGIGIAKGKYLAFLDSDDWIHDLCIEKLYTLLQKTHADISACNFIWTSDELVTVDDPTDTYTVYSNTEALALLYGELYIPMVVAWGKLYKAELFDGIRYPKGKLHEDEFTTHKLLYKAKTVVFSTDQLLYYWQRSDSITGVGFNLKNRLAVIQALYERVDFFQEKELFALRDSTYRRLFYKYKGILEYVSATNNVEVNKTELVTEFTMLRKKLRLGTYSMKFRIFYELYYLMPGVMKAIFALSKKPKE